MNFRNNKTYIFIGLLVFFAVTILIPYFVFGAQSGTVEAKIFKSTEGPGIAYWVNAVYLWSAGVIGILAVATVIFAGIQYITSVGSQDAIGKAKEKIGAALAGILLILLSYVILYTLDPRLVKIGFEIEELKLKGSDIQELQMTVPSTTFKVKTQEEAKTQCVNYCKDKGGTPTVTQAYATETGWECKCEGATKTPECSVAADCEKLCAGQEDKEPCKDAVFYCKDKKCSLGKKNADAQGNLIGLDDDEGCGTGWTADENDDKKCKSGLCLTKSKKGGMACGKPAEAGAGCERDIECASGICGFSGSNKCAPSGGLPFGESCDDNGECASKNCETEDDNTCVREGGNLEDEDCEKLGDCKPNIGLYCNDEWGDDMCRCSSGSKWDAKEGKCAQK